MIDRGESLAPTERTTAMKIARTLAIASVSGLLLAAVPVAAQADEIRRTGNYTVRAGQTIDDDLVVRGGTVRIYGTVEGNVRQIGKGSVIVHSSGKVDGNVSESGSGHVRVYGEVDGNVAEKGSGHVRVYRNGKVDGNVAERDKGTAYVRGTVDGNVSENGAGHVYVYRTAKIDGNVYERKAGNLYYYRGADVDGNIKESGAGKRVNR